MFVAFQTPNKLVTELDTFTRHVCYLMRSVSWVKFSCKMAVLWYINAHTPTINWVCRRVKFKMHDTSYQAWFIWNAKVSDTYFSIVIPTKNNCLFLCCICLLQYTKITISKSIVVVEISAPNKPCFDTLQVQFSNFGFKNILPFRQHG